MDSLCIKTHVKSWNLYPFPCLICQCSDKYFHIHFGQTISTDQLHILLQWDDHSCKLNCLHLSCLPQTWIPNECFPLTCIFPVLYLGVHLTQIWSNSFGFCSVKFSVNWILLTLCSQKNHVDLLWVLLAHSELVIKVCWIWHKKKPWQILFEAFLSDFL